MYRLHQIESNYQDFLQLQTYLCFQFENLNSIYLSDNWRPVASVWKHYYIIYRERKTAARKTISRVWERAPLSIKPELTQFQMMLKKKEQWLPKITIVVESYSNLICFGLKWGWLPVITTDVTNYWKMKLLGKYEDLIILTYCLSPFIDPRFACTDIPQPITIIKPEISHKLSEEAHMTALLNNRKLNSPYCSHQVTIWIVKRSTGCLRVREALGGQL